ncbi:MAG: carboxypeptidase regulatory-like domain-containing protein, partial [Acidobacteria bacterium]|nr:carboxypeptidase regulatory-like domain-containing protein [Acidobacteriota bacterium]
MKRNGNQHWRLVVFTLAVFLPLFVAELNGQGASATILGVAKDSTGGVLPGVTVTVRNTATGVERTVITDDGGRYQVPELGVGSYEIVAELTGFQTTVRRGITLTVGQQALIELILNVGEMTERVEVLGEAPQVDTTSSTIAGLVDESQVRSLPLNARSLIELAPLKTGVAFVEFGGDASPLVGFAKKITIAGSRPNASLFQLDGASITDRQGAPGSAAGLMMGVETIREFNVITNAYSSEYGSHTGGVFNAVTKSGTNEIHGSAFEFHRNDNLDARNFFDRNPKDPLTRNDPPEFKRNQFGGSVGGPIVKNRTFFFGSFEGLREALGITDITNVPSLAARSGLVPNPATGQVRNVGVAPKVKPFLELYPEPNGVDFGDGRAEFIRGISRVTEEDFWTIRLDHNFSSSHSLFGRYTFDDGQRSVPDSFTTLGSNATRNQYLTLSHTTIISPKVVNKFVVGFTRANVGQREEPLPGKSPLKSFTQFQKVGGQQVYGGLNAPGMSSLSTRPSPSIFEVSNYFQYKDDLSYVRGSHSMKFGANVERRQDNRSQGMYARTGNY